MPTSSFLGCFAFTLATLVAGATEPPVIERWDRVVCIQSQVENKPDTGKLCSGFLISSEGRLFLVTAGHASEETNRSSKLYYRDPAGATQWVMLKVLFPESVIPWK